MNLLLRFFALLITFSVSSLLYAQKRVACIGDSVTKGYGIKDSTQSYPSQLQALLGNDFIVGDFGHSGATLLKNGHNPYINTQAYKDALVFNADVVVIALGLNDTDPRNWPNYSNDFFADYSALINDFKKVNPNVEVYICWMTPIFSGHTRFLSGTRDWFDQIQELIGEIALVNKATLIDNHSPLASRIDLFEDNLHPSAYGAQIIANNVFQYLVPSIRQLEVYETFSNHMVLQRNVSNTIAGLASSNVSVEIEFNNNKYTTQSNALGKWEVSLPAMKAGGPYTIKISAGRERILLEDILFGDVYLASGQSNMAFQLQSMNNAKAYYEQVANQPEIRLFKNKNLVETNPVVWDSAVLQKVNDLDFFSGQWEVPQLDNIKDFSAIAYVFANELNSALDVPIGIIDLSVGGSSTESWIPRKVMEDDNLLATYIHNWRNSDFIQDFCRTRAAKNLEATKAKYQRHPYEPAYNFEAGVKKFIYTNLKGFLWYQGESNAHNIEHHAYLFEKLVSSWRIAFNQDLPFYFVQLSSINRPSWGAFRDSQRLLLANLPNVYMAISYDYGDPFDVHPREKEIIAKRLSDLALQHEYKKEIQANSPQPTELQLLGDFINLSFSNCKDLRLRDTTIIKDLKVMDDFGQLIPIENIQIDKNKIRFKKPETGAKYVQYAFTAFTDGNLVSDSDIPVSTFSIKIK